MTTDTPVQGFRLSPQQVRVWSLQQAAPAAPLHAWCAVRLRGGLDRAALEAAIASVAGQHEILRTTFRVLPDVGLPVQVVGEGVRVPVEHPDPSGPGPRERAEEEAAWLRSLGGAGEAGAEGTLLRAVLFPRGEGEHALYLGLPAVCGDARTLDNLVAQVAAAYGQIAAGGAAAPDEAVQYVDFSEWINEMLASDEARDGREFWSARSAPVASAALLPDRWPAGVNGAGPVGTHARTLGPALTRALDDAAAAHGVQPAAWLLAAWQALLVRHAEAGDLTVGVKVEGRTFPEFQGSLGPFARYVPVPGQVREGQPFAALAAEAQAALAEAGAWQDFYVWDPASAPAGTEAAGPGAFGFDYAEPALDAGERAGVAWRVERRWHQLDRFALRLSVERVDEGGAPALLATVYYDAATQSSEGAARLLRRFGTLLADTLRAPATGVDALSLLDDGERDEVLLRWNATAAELPADVPVHRLFQAQARRTPDAVAVGWEGGTLTYGALDARAGRWAHALRARGVGPDARVGLLVERSPEMVAGILGVLEAGGAYVPLDPALPADRLRFVAGDGGLALVVAGAGLEGRLGGDAPVPVVSVAALEAEAPEADGPPAGEVSGLNLAYVLYTSGSTGTPKGVMVEHRGLANQLAWMQARFPLGGDDVVLQKTPFGFDASVWEILAPLLAGARLELAPEGSHADGPYLAAAVARHGVTVLQAVPSQLRLVQAAGGLAGWGGLRRLFSGGEALTEALRDAVAAALPHVELVNLYGPTETTVQVAYWPCAAGERGPVPIGGPVANARLYVLDAALRPVPVGVRGEVYAGGIQVSRGYAGRPGLTAERFVPDPFGGEPGARLYRTGDRARRRPDGALEYLGRADDQVKVRGYRVEPGEIERRLEAHPGVRAAAVAVRGGAGEERLVAYWTPAGDGGAASADDLRAYLQGHLPPWMVPAAFVALDALPLLPSGKVDRRALPDPAEAPAAVAYEAPATVVEEALALVWAEVLGVERVGVHDNFFALGGDSILSIRVVGMARDRGLKLVVQDLFEHQTVRALAPRVGTGAAEAEAMERILTRDRRPFDLVSDEDRAKLPADAVDAYPLSALQTGMLFEQQVNPEAPAYHNVNSYHFRGAFDEGAFRAALQRAVELHDNLRTSIHLAGFSEALQVVHARAEVPVVVEDLRHLADDAQERWLDAFRAREFRALHDLTRAPLMRVHVHLRAADRFQLTLTECHTIADGWSTTSLFAEVFEDHAALLRGDPLPERAAPAVRVRDFVEMERAAAGSEASRRFWAERLDGLDPAPLPRLPAAFRDPAAGAGTESIPVPLSPELRAGLRGLARTLAVPLQSVLLAGHLKVLGALTGAAEAVTGMTTNGRPEVSGGTEVRGLFLNVVPLRVPLRAESWEALVRDVFRAELEILPHRRYPRALMQREHGAGRLFEAAFNLTRFHSFAQVLRTGTVEVLGMSDVAGTSLPLLTAVSLDLSTADISTFLVQYRRDDLDRAQAEAIADRYRRVYEAMVADPSGRHDRLSLVSAEERARVVDAWNRTDVAYPADAPVHRLFQEQAARAPDAVALVHGDDETTYGELNTRANRLAHHLMGRGVGLESPVGVYLERGPELVVALLAVLKAGGAYVPLEPGYPAERLAYMAADAGVAVLVTQGSLRGALPAAPGLAVVSVDEDAADIARASGADPEGGAGAGSLAYVMYTSGSTGVPKGVAVEHRGVVRLVRGAGYARFGPDEVLLQAAPVSFDASTLELWGALLHGARLVLMPPGAPTLEALGHALRRHGVTTLWLTAGLFQAMAEARLDDLAGLRQLLAGGDVLPAAQVSRVLHRHPGLRLINGYGPTEGTTFTCCHTVPAGWSGASVPIGRPVSNTRVYVLDAAGEPVAPGVPGELYAGGDGVARGYAGRPGLTAERFVPDPFGGRPGARLYRTGDRARWLPDGTLEYLGRLDGQVKIRGFRVEPGEVEGVLASHSGVREARVVVREDVPGEKRLVAYVVGDADPDGVRGYLRERLPEPLVPSAVVPLDALPLTPNGKLDRGALPAPEHGARAPYVAPRTPAEGTLAEIWAEVLRRERVGVEESFFELGGHSLLAIRMITRVREVFGVEMPLRTLFENPTVAGVARALESAPGDEAVSAITPAGAAEPVLAGLGELPEEEVDRLLRELSMDEEHGG